MASSPAIQIGPFIGGLNTFSDPTSVADNELVECLNFELDLDGSLKSRPAFIDANVTMPLGATGNMELLGYYYGSGSVAYLIASDGLSSTYYFNGSSWVLLTDTISATAMAQFNNKAWLMAPVGSANPGGYWSPDDGFVPDANMPKGEVIVAYKYRLWCAVGKGAASEGTRLYYSKILGQPDFWASSNDFIDVGAGDGQDIVQVVVYYSSLLIFRTNSIHSFQYTSDPSSGTVQLAIPGVGLSSKDTIVPFENYIYFMYDDKAYELVNSRASQINVKVPFEAILRTGIYKPYCVSIFNKRVIFSYYDTMYVFSLKTRTWTRWRSAERGPIGKIVSVVSDAEYETAVAHSSLAVPITEDREAAVFFLSDQITTDTENFQCIAQTKNYSYEASSNYKRLFWWGADAVFRGVVTAIANPITYNYSVTWGQLLSSGVTWGDLLNFTWGRMMSDSISVETVRDLTGAGSMRKFVKFLKGIRFRQVNFRLVFDTDGSINTAPVRLFTLMTYAKAKERVSKAVS